MIYTYQSFFLINCDYHQLPPFKACQIRTSTMCIYKKITATPNHECECNNDILPYVNGVPNLCNNLTKCLNFQATHFVYETQCGLAERCQEVLPHIIIFKLTASKSTIRSFAPDPRNPVIICRQYCYTE